MKLSRRDLAAAGAFALGAAGLLHSAPAQAEGADDAALNQAVEASERPRSRRTRRNSSSSSPIN